MTHADRAGRPRDRQIPSAPPTSDYRAVEFSSDGAVLRGRLYLPGRPARVVVMGHGFSATIPMVMDRYAECFRDRGLAVLALTIADTAPATASHGARSTTGYRRVDTSMRSAPPER